MKRGLLITLEGTDASGKANQLQRLHGRFTQEGIPFESASFPTYETPSGKIVGGPVLGKPEICDSYFEHPSKEDGRGISLYYCANRRFELPWMNEVLQSGKHAIFDRYVDSNKACQGGKEKDPEKRMELYNALDFLEYEFAELPRPDITMFLHMPYQIGRILKSQMGEKTDRVEQDVGYLKNQEMAYIELAGMNNWPHLMCFPLDKVAQTKTYEEAMKHIKSFDEIHEDIWSYISDMIPRKQDWIKKLDEERPWEGKH